MFVQLARRTSATASRPVLTPPTFAPDVAFCLSTREDALEWLRTEHPNLMACADHATERALHRRIVRLTAALLLHEDAWHDAAALEQVRLAAARRDDDCLGRPTHYSI
ncbi:hypothetical protein OG735_06110 [Streptomyces sp. NBC_01210]|uniref:hypothetical protein n=1 Tax=Streptomyces sp. NBC_01210 TaxID=2903774 RepID=UPI002E0EC449|nr:hypothetical protein OG735_06110 [Streptomyces sp. NBC_01210]